MKKLVLATLVLVAGFTSLNAQEIADNAIGLRLGASDGFGTEISYLRALGDNNRLEIDLGWKSDNDFNAYRITGLYQWVWELDGNFNWYAGAGGGLASYSFDSSIIDDESYLFIAGDIGIEYRFDIPLLLSLDVRPEIGIKDFNNELDFDVALGIRYQF
jgi:hypothetical protein